MNGKTTEITTTTATVTAVAPLHLLPVPALATPPEDNQARSASPDDLRCAHCGRAFAFASGETALVLRHTAYGYDFVHDGSCLAAAREALFLEPGYDRAAFARDPVRRRVLDVQPSPGWAAVLMEPEHGRRRRPVRLEPLRWWALVEHRDGSRRLEGLVRDDEWLDEPGGAEFPEAAQSSQVWLGYAAPGDAADPARWAEWEARARARYFGAVAAPGRGSLPVRVAA